MRRTNIAALVALFAGSAASAQFLMIPDSGTGDRVMLFSEADGSLIDLNWITDIGAVGWFFTTPKEAKVIRDEIWVSDQVADAIHRFDFGRNFLGSITAHPNGGVIDNIRGFGYDGSKVYLTVFHATVANRGIVVYSDTGVPTALFQSSASFFDIAPFMGDMLVTNSTSNNVERRSVSDGSLISNFATGITFPQGVEVLSDNSVLAVSTIAAEGVEGVYHFNPDGSLRRFIDTQGIKNAFGEQVPRAAWLLGDGEYLITTSIGVFKTQGAGFVRIVGGVDAQFINPIPAPGAMGLLAAGLALIARRRR